MMMTTSDEMDIYGSDAASAWPAASSGAGLIFSCSSSTREGSGSFAITSDAVHLGETGGVVRVNIPEIRAWYTESRGSLFALTVVGERPYATVLFAELRTAVSGVLMRFVGPERKDTLDT